MIDSNDPPCPQPTAAQAKPDPEAGEKRVEPPRREPYVKPAILSVELLEVIASVCDPLYGGKAGPPAPCGTIHS